VQSLLQSDRLGAEDRLAARDLLEVYQAIGKVRGAASQETLDILGLLFASLIRLEERCLDGRPQEDMEQVQTISLFAAKRATIVNSYLAGDYQGVIDGCIDLEKVLGPDSLTPEIGLMFALSLGKRGMIQEALQVGAKISDDLERKPGFIHLRAKMIEWQLALGERGSAIQSYEKLVDNLHEREAVLKAAERNLSGEGRVKPLPKRTGETVEPVPPIDLSKEPGSTQDVLRQVDALVRRSDFESAKLLLLRSRIRLQDDPEAERVDQAMKSVEWAEAKAREQKQAETSEKQEALELAANLMEQERYEEAIAELDTLGRGQALSPEAKQLQDLAVEKIINRERNKAAKLFLMARNTKDPLKKKELLVSSYNTLKVLVDKYPSSPLQQKINDNMQRIQEELSKLKTTGLPFIPSPGGRG
jgi:tetratricopeptide (TPR) repeat protein